jgi:Helix-turn-helix domain
LGITPGRYVEQARLEAARRQLELTEKSQEEVAASCGFGSAELLRRAFLRVLESTPGRYRTLFHSATRIDNHSRVRVDRRQGYGANTGHATDAEYSATQEEVNEPASAPGHAVLQCNTDECKC